MKRLKICCSILMFFISMTLFAGCDSKLTSIQVINGSVETSIAYGRTLTDTDFEDLEVLASFQDGTSRIVTYVDNETDFEIDYSSIVPTTPGEYEVDITYRDVTTTVTITVAVAHITGFEVDRSAIETTIGYGMTPTWSSLIVKAVYADGTKTPLTSGYLVDTSTFISTTAGTYTITVGYGSFTPQTFTVEVLATTLTGIELDLNNVETNLMYSTSLDLANDLVVKAVYSDNSKTTITNYSVDNDNFSPTTSGTYTITITYGEFSETFDVTVATAHITGFVIDRTAIPATIAWGTTPTWSSLIVKAVYADATEVTLDSADYFVNTSTFTANTAGTYTITVGYSTFASQTFTVQVLAPVVSSIELDLSSVETTLLYGNSLNVANLIVKARYTDNSLTTLTTEDYSVDTGSFDSTTAGTYTITVNYSETIFKTFEVTVAQPHVTGIAIDRTAIPTSVGYGSEIDWTNLIVKSVYADNSEEVITDYELDTSAFNSTVAGVQTIYVSYLTFSTSFTITVSTTTGTFAYDGDTLVIYKSVDYTLGANVTDMTYTKEGTETPVAIEGTALVINELGNFTFNYKIDGVAKEKEIKVVPWISSFGVGESVTLFNNGTTTATTNFISTADNTYKVGTESYFYFDISMNNAFITNQEYINFNFVASTTIDGTYEPISDLVVGTEENETYGTGFMFNSDYNGYFVRATITPTYNNRAPIVMEFVLVAGVNVFSDAQLKVAYGSLSVQSINIHRTIVCTLSANQTNADGVSPLNYDSLDGHVTNNEDGVLIANNTGNVYARYSDSTTNDNLVVNGNYQTINGSYLPLINLDYAGVNGQPGSLKDLGGNPNGVVSSQIAIFKSEIRASTTVATGLTTTLEYNTANNNNIVYNNLVVIGNTVVPEDSQGSALLTNSGSYAGIRASYNDVTTNNCIIKNTCIGLFMDGEGTDAIAENTKIYESWANLIYFWDANILQLTNCQLSNAGGAAVWMDDVEVSDIELQNPTFKMDANTTITNFVTGAEAWFVAYNMADIATGIKGALDTQIAPYGKTILKTTAYPDGNGGTINVEKFNFAVVINEDFDTPNLDEGDTLASGTFQIGNIIVARNYGTTPLDKGENPFLCDVTTQAFADRVTELVNYYMSEAGGSKTYDDALATAQQQAYVEQANYLEVVEDTGYGVIHMITTIYGNNYLGTYATSAELISAHTTALYYDHAYVTATESSWYWNDALSTPAWVNQKITQAAYDALSASEKAAVPYIIVS